MLGRQWAGTGGELSPIPDSMAVGKPALHQEPSQITLWVTSCSLGSVVAALSLRDPSEPLFFLHVLLADQELFLAAEEANGGTRSDLVLRVPAWSGGLNPTSCPNSCPDLPLMQSDNRV